MIGKFCHFHGNLKLEIADNTYIGLGSVVVYNSQAPGVLLAGEPAKVVKRGIIARKSLQHFSMIK